MGDPSDLLDDFVGGAADFTAGQSLCQLSRAAVASSTTAPTIMLLERMLNNTIWASS